MKSCPHNEDFECFSCADERHAREHPELVEGCRTCKLQTIRISPKVAPSSNSAPPTWHQNRNSWEKGTVKDARGVPLLGEDLQPIGVKRYGEQRHKFEARRHELATSPRPFGGKE